MLTLMILFTVLVLTVGQGFRQNPQTAAIISEQRYLTGDGKFGATYSQEDGIHFKEETDSDGTRHGSYSYVDPTGQRRTTSYTAGKNGFQPSGDHLPVPLPAPEVPSQPQSQNQPPNNNYQAFKAYDEYDDGSYDARYDNPDINQQGYHSLQTSYNTASSPPKQATYNHPVPPQYTSHRKSFQPTLQQYDPTTQKPQRFQPPGKLSLNRTPDGFSYSFNKA